MSKRTSVAARFGGFTISVSLVTSFAAFAQTTAPHAREDDGFSLAEVIVTVSIAGLSGKTPGYFSDILRDRRTGEIDSNFLQAKALFKPNDSAEVLVPNRPTTSTRYSAKAITKLPTGSPSLRAYATATKIGAIRGRPTMRSRCR